MSSSVAITQQTFIHSTSLVPTVHKVKLRVPTTPPTVPYCKISSQEDRNDSDSPRNTESQLAKLAIAALAAGVLTLGSAQKASAAKSSGRVGGQEGLRSPTRRSSTPGIMAVRSDMYETPTLSPTSFGGNRMSFGMPCCAGWGWTPLSLSVLGPRVSGARVAAVREGGGFQFLTFLLVLGAAALGGTIIRSFYEEVDDSLTDVVD